MPRFTREVEIDAVQFTGHNWKTVQDFVGSRVLDPAGKYSFPLFDEADTWLPERATPEDFPAVVQVRGTWQLVRANDWIIREGDDLFAVMSNEEFINTYGEPVAAKKRATRKKS